MKSPLWLVALLLLASGLRAEPVTATVAVVDQSAKTFTLEDGRVVRVSPGDTAVGYVGRPIRGQIDEQANPPALYAVWPNDPAERATEQAVNAELHAQTEALGRRAFRAVGDEIPDFALYDQNGQLVRREDLRGKNVVMNFIFTRCKMPTMCPASTARMVQLQRMIDEADLQDAQLITLSFDPVYDTPGTLNEYARQRGAHFGNFRLLTGDPAAVHDLLKQFGILTVAEDGTINHTAATVLIDPEGVVAYRKEGPNWSPDAFFAQLQERERK